MKGKRFVVAALLGLLILSGCGSARHIPIKEFKPTHLEKVTFPDALTIRLNHYQKEISYNEFIVKGLTDYLAVHAPTFRLADGNTQTPFDLTLDLYTKRMGILISDDVKLKTRLHDAKGIQLSRSCVFPSQKSSKIVVDQNERYNMGLYSGRMLLQSIADDTATFLSMSRANNGPLKREVDIALKKKEEEDLRHKTKVEAFIASNDFHGLKGYTDENPNAAYFIQSRAMRLMFTGPKGMKVGDIRKLVKDGRSDTIVVSLIKRVNTPYKEFTLEEIDILSGMGLSDRVISSMIDVTTELLKDEERRKEQEFLLEKMAQNKPATAVAAAGAGSQDSIGKSVGRELTKQGVKLLLDQLF